MKRSSVFIVLFAAIVASCAYSQQPSPKDFEGFSRIDVAYRTMPSDRPEDFDKMGQVFVEYRKLDTQYVTPFGRTKALIAEVVYCAGIGEKLLILGRVNKDGAFDSNGKPVKLFSNTDAGEIVGISGDIVETPFLPSLVLQDGKDVGGHLIPRAGSR